MQPIEVGPSGPAGAQGESTGAETPLDRPRPSRTSFWLYLAAIAVGALILRVGFVVALRNHALSGDGLAYHLSAGDLRNGHGFVNPFAVTPGKAFTPAANHPPGWTLVLAVLPLIGLTSLLTAQIFAALVGVATVVVVGLAARLITSDRGALIAAALAALYPGLWVYEQELLSETLLFLGVALVLIAAYRYKAKPTRGRAMVVGALCGVAALIRSEEILLVAVLLVPLILGWRWRNITRQRLESLVLACAMTALVIAPWTLYNVGRVGEPVVLSTTLGPAMAQGNCNSVYSGRLLGYYDFLCIFPAIRDAKTRGAAKPDGDSALRHQSISYIRHHLGRFPLVSIARQGRTWSLFRPLQTADFEAAFAKALTWPHRAAVFFYWALLPAAVVGGVVLRRRHVSLIPLLAPFVVTAIAVATTYGQPRLRAAAEVPLVLLAAVGIERLTARSRDGSSTTEDTPQVAMDDQPERV